MAKDDDDRQGRCVLRFLFCPQIKTAGLGGTVGPPGSGSPYSEKPMVKPKEMSLNISSKNVSM